MNISSSEAFDFDGRAGASTMSARAYVLALTLLISGGIALAAYMASLTYTMTPNLWWVLAYFAISIPGIIMSAKSDNWFVSLIGYGMVVTATGGFTGPYVHMYTLDSVLQVLAITVGASAAIGFAGAIYPKNIEHWGGFLLMGLFVLIFADLAQIFMVSMGFTPVSLQWFDWVAVGLFSALIFYDMNRAMRLPHTLDSAVDSAVALYLDIINLFIRLLAIMGKKDD